MNLEKSLAMQQRAKELIPGMTQLLSKRPDMFSSGVWPGYYAKAKGAEVWDLDGNRYIDMSIAGIGANILGYADEDVDTAVIHAIQNGSSSSLSCPEEVELADLFCELHPWADKVRYARCGGEGMAIAVRIARAHTGKDIVAFCGYHGWADWYLAANLGTENALGEHLISGLDPAGVPKGLAGTALPFRYNQIEELEAIIAKHGNNLAAIVMEPIRNHDPLPGFFDRVREIADTSGAVFIIDEVSAGLRMNTGGAHLLYNIKPDIAVFSKSLGNGFPIAAIIGRGKVMDSAQKSFISSTMWTERVGPTAALATLKKHRDKNVGDHLIKIGKMVQEGWQRCADTTGLQISVGGIYPCSHFGFTHEKPQHLKSLFIQLMLEQGFLASNLCYVMYAHTSEHVNQYLGAVEKAFREIADAISKNDIEKRMKGAPSSTGFKRIA